MPDQHDANSDSAGRSPLAFDNFGDWARFRAASYGSFAEGLEHSQRQLSAVFDGLPSIPAEEAVTVETSAYDLLSGIDEGAQRARLLGWSTRRRRWRGITCKPTVARKTPKRTRTTAKQLRSTGIC